MKAFVALALLVASVAAQSSLDTFRVNKFQYPLTGLFGQERYGGLHDYPVGKYEIPSFGRFNFEGVNFDQTTVLSIEEIFKTELFQEYYAIPLFRQYFQYPVFRQYIASPFFQHFYVNRGFQTYFRNPYLFQTYILPQVQVISRFYGPVSTGVYERSVFDRFPGFNNEVYNKNVYGDYSYGINSLPYTTGYYPQVDSVNYKFLLEKIYRSLLHTPIVGGVATEVQTDVNVFTKPTVDSTYVRQGRDIYNTLDAGKFDYQSYYNKYTPSYFNKYTPSYFEKYTPSYLDKYTPSYFDKYTPSYFDKYTPSYFDKYTQGIQYPAYKY